MSNKLLSFITLLLDDSPSVRNFAVPVLNISKGAHIAINIPSTPGILYKGTVEDCDVELVLVSESTDTRAIYRQEVDKFYSFNPEYHIEFIPPITNNNNNSKKSFMKNKMFDSYFKKLKEQFMPEVDTSLQVTMDGQIAVPTSDGDFVAIKGEELTSYPAEMTLDMPVYVLAKKVEDVKAGDIIKSGNSYSKVTKVNKNNQGKLVSFSTLSYSGHGKTVKPITDFLLGQSTVKVVINLMSGFGDINGINPMMLMALKDGDTDNNNLLMLMAMQQMNGTALTGTTPMLGGINPMMFMLMGGENKNDTLQTILMMQMMGGNMNLFGGTPVAPSESAE